MTQPIAFLDGPWWPYLALILFAVLPTEIWRWLAVGFARGLSNDSPLLEWVRAVATALVAAVIAKLIFFPTGSLETSPLWLRLGAVVVGALFFFFGGRFRQILGIFAAIAFLAAGLALTGA